MLSAELREYAEVPDRFSRIADGSSVTRFDDGRICVLQGPTWASISAPNVDAGAVGELLELAHELVPAEKGAVWWLGPSARPADIADRLRAAGLTEPRDRVGRLIALALTDEPAAVPAGVDVRRVETFEDFAAAREVQWDAFDTPAERRESGRRRLDAEFEETMATGIPAGFIAVLEGRVAASAMSVPADRGVFLIAGATAPWARGRGLYRALIRARWDDAVARGTPALITQANPETSYPILKRLGFEDVCEIVRLEDVRRQSTGSTSPDS